MSQQQPADIYGIEVQRIDGECYTLQTYRRQVMLIVNTASKCGFTPQYEGLEALHQRYQSKGLAVLGFPCNQFGQQEPGSEESVAEFCQLNYGVSFTMHSKVDVNGKQAHPLFVYLKAQAPGALGTSAIKWNFTKFLVNRQGEVIKRFAPATKPQKLAPSIETLLG